MSQENNPKHNKGKHYSQSSYNETKRMNSVLMNIEESIAQVDEAIDGLIKELASEKDSVKKLSLKRDIQQLKEDVDCGKERIKRLKKEMLSYSED